MCCFYWLMNKELAWPIAWEDEGGVREKPWSYWRQTLGTLAAKPQPGCNIQINRDMSLARNTLKLLAKQHCK